MSVHHVPAVMNQNPPVRAFELRRLFIGTTPPLFLLEIVVRAIFVYVILLVAIRMMGKRVAGQLSLSELAVIVTLGAAVGVPIEVPEHGMLPAVLVLAVAVGYQRAIGLLSFKNRKIELLTQGDLVCLVENGELNLPRMKGGGLSRERLFAALREKSIVHLGEVARLYYETSGGFSIYRSEGGRPGLRIVPPDHPGLKSAESLNACSSCGHLESRHEPPERCPRCSARDWFDAVQ
jgi:uncharacterized membrane protein YcaP (DUF421 family)